MCCSFLSGVSVQGGPDETGELTGDGDDGLARRLTAGEHASEAAVESEHGLVGEGDDGGRLSEATVAQAVRIRAVAVMPCGLDEQAACMAIAGLGDAAAALGVGGRELGRNESKESHEPAW